jgi:hypothetical protein
LVARAQRLPQLASVPIFAESEAGIPTALKSPAEVAAMLPGEVQKWAAVIRAANIAVE